MTEQEISGRTKVCVALGDPVESSLSPKMHNSGYRACGIASEYVYIAARVTASELSAALAGLKAMRFRGASCLMPHKTALLDLVDEVDPHAARVGAINTLVNDDGKVVGYNTDWLGVANALEAHISLARKRVVVLGNGGAARAAAYGVVQRGAFVTVVGRSIERAATLAQALGGESSTFEGLEELLPDTDVIVNATPVGMEDPTTSPVELRMLRPHHFVLDTVYHPHHTKLLRDTLEQGGTAVYGIEMLLHQGLEQFRLFTGHEPPADVMKRVLWDALA